jgi:multidrug efflux pump subunit AcrA (membrane-fusion protein)
MQKLKPLTRIIASVSVFIVLIAAGCARKEESPVEQAAPVQTATAQRAAIRRIITARAILYPLDQAVVMPKISAPVREFYVNRGDHVRKGQLLAQLENRDLTAAEMEAKGGADEAEANYRNTTAATLPEELAKAQSEVQSAREAHDAAQKLYESRKQLLEQGALPRRQADEANVALAQARSQYEVAEKHLDALQKVGKDAGIKQSQAQLDAAKGRYQNAQAQLEYSRITSPLGGVVTDRPMYAGELASPSTPLLTVMDISQVIARANVPADQLKFLRVGDEATITEIDSSAGLHGKVTVVSPALDANSTTAEVWIKAPNSGELLKPGSSVQVSIVAETVENAIVIPPAAILPSTESLAKVLVFGNDSLAHERGIEIGIRESDKVQVLKGLEQGEQVIIVGGFGLADKAKVRIEKTDEKTEKHE